MEKINREEIVEKKIEQHNMLEDAYNHVFNSPEGKIVLEDLMMFTNMYNSCFGKDNNETNKKLGSRVVGLYIMDRINHKFSKTAEMQKRMGNYKGENNGSEKRQ